jgi:hypothetical protein
MANPSIDSGGPAVYLCQVSPGVSCGACCGLYNVADASLEAIEAMLSRRTRWFADVPRSVAGIDAFKERVAAAESSQRPFPEFHHCVYLGMIEDAGRRVGCLLHPLAAGNAGQDWRGLSYYGGMACRTYFCPSLKKLPARWLAALRASINHWYLHGLIVTERHLLAALFAELERRLARTIDVSDFTSTASSTALMRTLTALKLDWPFRRRNAPGVCNYFFEDGQYQRPPVVGRHDAMGPSRFEAILRELDSELSSADDLAAAEAIIDSLLVDLVSAVKRR